MAFGDVFRPADAPTSTAWIDEACRGEWWTVGALVPNRYESLLRVHAPDPSPGDWWSSYRDLYRLVAAVGERHTATPDRAWFAIWEGHGFDTFRTNVAWREPPADDHERRERAAYRRQLHEDDERRHAEIRDGLGAVPTFEAPHRTYYLVTGAVADVDGLRYPSGDGWRNPDLWWPDDRRWFVATDVDCWALYVGGDDEFIGELARHTGTLVEHVQPTDWIEIET